MNAPPAPPEGTPLETAPLFEHAGGQAVALPEAFRFPGAEVRIIRDGERVILEAVKQPKMDTAFWAKLDAMGAMDFLPDGLPEETERLQPGPTLSFE